MRIIVADDAPFIVEITKSLLVRAGYEVIATAENGQIAVELCRRLKPDVILMDLVMPVLSGVEAAKLISKELPEIRIIGFSTIDQEHMIVKAIEAGCKNFLPKPFLKEDLLRVLEREAG